MSDKIEAIRTRLAGPIEHSHSDHQRAIEDCRALLTAYDGRHNDALSMELQRDQALRELAALRAENERLKRSFGERYDDKRDMPSIIEHLRYGDSDGDDHDAAAAEIERLLGDCAAWRNALAVSRAKCERLEQQQVIIQGAHDHALQTIRRAEISHGQRIERLEATLRHISHHAEDPITREIAAQELAAAGGQQEKPQEQKPKVNCEKCGGYGWLRGKELDNPSEDTYADTMTKYPCDGDAHSATGDGAEGE